MREEGWVSLHLLLDVFSLVCLLIVSLGDKARRISCIEILLIDPQREPSKKSVMVSERLVWLNDFFVRYVQVGKYLV